MRRFVALLVLACVAPVVPADAGIATVDVYRSSFLAVDNRDRAWSMDVVVEDRPAGAQLVVEVARRCASCKPEVYAKKLGEGDFVVSQLAAANPECQCMSAAVTARFGGKRLRVEWAWDPEQGGSPADGGTQWTAVSANNLLNVSCYGTGSVTSTPDPLSDEEPRRPKGARAFPKEMPSPFEASVLATPGCFVESP